MAREFDPDDYSTRSVRQEDENNLGRRADARIQPDLELVEGKTSSGRIAAFAVAILVVLGVVFYGLSSSMNNSTTATAPVSANQNSAQNKSASPPANSQPGATTGTAPAQPSGTDDQSKASGSPPTR
jgi:hypothetical protein